MIPTIPFSISIFFILTTCLTTYFFYRATGNSKEFIRIISVWALLQGVVSFSGFYTNTSILPPRFLFLILIPMLTIASIFFLAQGRIFMEALDAKWLTLLHVVRIPVELILFALATQKAIPELMTFEGRNWDIFSGLTAPLILYFGFTKKAISNKLLIVWNVLCLLLLINIVVNAILSAPTPFQRFAFDQPNIAVLYFPFTWLPSIIVPLVLFSHLVCIWKLMKTKS